MKIVSKASKRIFWVILLIFTTTVGLLFLVRQQFKGRTSDSPLSPLPKTPSTTQSLEEVKCQSLVQGQEDKTLQLAEQKQEEVDDCLFIGCNSFF